MTKTISREEPFQVLATNFSISPSSSGYTLQISADGVNYTDLFSVGANITRMVTGVANGSYYRLRGNTDTGVVINWRTQCSDGGSGEGGGSTYILPPATDRTLGGVKVGNGLSVTPDGTLSATGSGEGGDDAFGSNVLYSTDNLDDIPEDKEIVAGDVRAKSVEAYTIGWDVPYGENLETATYTFPADFDITQYSQSNQYFVGKFVNTAREGDTMYGEYNVYVFNDSSNGPIVRLNDETGAGSVSIPTMGEGEGDYGSVEVTYEDTGLNFYVGADPNLEVLWSPEFQLVEGTSLQSVYESDGIWQYVGNGKAVVGGWVGPIFQTIESIASIEYDKNSMSYFWYDYLDESMFTNGELELVRTVWNYTENQDWTLKLRWNNGDPILVAVENNTSNELSIEKNDSNWVMYGYEGREYNVKWVDGNVIIKSYPQFLTVTKLTDVIYGHWVKLNREPHFTMPTNNDNGDYGIPHWTKDGLVDYRMSSVNISRKRINTTGYGDIINLYTNEQHSSFQSWFIPTQPGTAGQVLTSAGDAEPRWATIIKAVKITAADYEALATKDPNTLYLIVG